MSQSDALQPIEWCANATHVIQEEDGCNVSPQMMSAIQRQKDVLGKHSYRSYLGGITLLWINTCYTSFEMFGLDTTGWAFEVDWVPETEVKRISVPAFNAMNIDKVCSLARHLFFNGNGDTSTEDVAKVRAVLSKLEMEKKCMDELQHYLSFDPLGAPKKFERKALGLKTRTTMYREFATLSASGIFDPPQADMPTAYVNPGIEIEDHCDYDVQIEALQRLVIRLEYLQDTRRKHFKASDAGMIAKNMYGRARACDEMFRFGRRLLDMCMREVAFRTVRLNVTKLLNTNEGFADALLPYIEPVAGVCLMQTCKRFYEIGKTHKRSYWLELVGCNTEATFPAHSDTARQDKDYPVINRDKMIRLVPRLCFKFLTAQENGPPVHQTHVFTTLALQRNLQSTRCSLHLVTIFGDEVPVSLGGVHLFNSASSPMLPTNWLARRFPKLRLFVSAKSKNYSGEAMAFQIKLCLSDGSEGHYVKLCGKSEPFYVTGRAMTSVGIEGAKRRDKRHRQNVQMAARALQHSVGN